MPDRITHEQAAEALDSLDDYARMDIGVDAMGPRGVLERYIAQQKEYFARIVGSRIEKSLLDEVRKVNGL